MFAESARASGRCTGARQGMVRILRISGQEIAGAIWRRHGSFCRRVYRWSLSALPILPDKAVSLRWRMRCEVHPRTVSSIATREVSITGTKYHQLLWRYRKKQSVQPTGKLLGYQSYGTLFRSLKTEWVPTDVMIGKTRPGNKLALILNLLH